jgi:hypothetical protein
MKKTRSKKSRDTVPLNPPLTVRSVNDMFKLYFVFLRPIFTGIASTRESILIIGFSFFLTCHGVFL